MAVSGYTEEEPTVQGISASAFSGAKLIGLLSLIGRIHMAIVAASGRSDRRGDDRPVYTPYNKPHHCCTP